MHTYCWMAGARTLTKQSSTTASATRATLPASPTKTPSVCGSWCGRFTPTRCVTLMALSCTRPCSAHAQPVLSLCLARAQAAVCLLVPAAWRACAVSSACLSIRCPKCDLHLLQCILLLPLLNSVAPSRGWFPPSWHCPGLSFVLSDASFGGDAVASVNGQRSADAGPGRIRHARSGREDLRQVPWRHACAQHQRKITMRSKTCAAPHSHGLSCISWSNSAVTRAHVQTSAVPCRALTCMTFVYGAS
jgi:hypothetical protein